MVSDQDLIACREKGGACTNESGGWVVEAAEGGGGGANRGPGGKEGPWGENATMPAPHPSPPADAIAALEAASPAT